MDLGMENTVHGMQEPPTIYCFSCCLETPLQEAHWAFILLEIGNSQLPRKLFLSEETPVSCSHNVLHTCRGHPVPYVDFARNRAPTGVRKTRSLPYGAHS